MAVRRACCLFIFCLLLGLVTFNPLDPAPAGAAWITVYNNDFQTSVGSEWSSSGTPIHIEATPLPSDGSRRFLGQFGNDVVSLSLPALPPHNQGRISFDLYVILSWDGNQTVCGPDICDLSIAGGPNIIHTTFTNIISYFPRPIPTCTQAVPTLPAPGPRKTTPWATPGRIIWTRFIT